MKLLLHARVSEILASNVESAFSESDPMGRLFRKTRDCVAQRVFGFHYLSNTGIVVGPGYRRAVRWTIDQERQANRGAISELARKRHFHVDLVARVERHRHE